MDKDGSTATDQCVKCIDVGLYGVDFLSKQFQRNVGGEYGEQFSVIIIQRIRISRHDGIGTALVEVRLAPIRLIKQFWNLIPIHVMIVIIFISKLFADNGIATAVRVRRKEMTFFG